MKYITILIIIAFIFGAGYYFTNRDANILMHANDTNNETEIVEPKNLSWSEAPEMRIDTAKKYGAVIKTSKGDMAFELFASETPVAVNNFVFLANQDFYKGVKFHRIIKGFMIQGGDPLGNGTGGPGYKFDDEPVTRDYDRGILAMANSGPNTNGSQFFIMHANNPLPKQYVIFGQLTDGFDVLDAIAETPVTLSASGENSSPTEDVIINGVEIVEIVEK